MAYQIKERGNQYKNPVYVIKLGEVLCFCKALRKYIIEYPDDYVEGRKNKAGGTYTQQVLVSVIIAIGNAVLQRQFGKKVSVQSNRGLGIQKYRNIINQYKKTNNSYKLYEKISAYWGVKRQFVVLQWYLMPCLPKTVRGNAFEHS